MADDGFHEIQLNGKQLVFLFMATTVVAVVIFLCGVMVGRGVRAEQAAQTVAETGTQTAPADAPPPSAVPAAPANATPPPPAEDLSYYDRLAQTRPPAEKLKAAPAREPVAPAARSEAAPPPPPVPSEAPPGKSAPLPVPADAPYTVQVVAFTSRSEAEAVLKDLRAKRFDPHLLAPSADSAMYRVRVGKFKNKRDAEELKRRLEKAQYKPWITR
jgi:cell division protein FtsN